MHGEPQKGVSIQHREKRKDVKGLTTVCHDRRTRKRAGARACPAAWHGMAAFQRAAGKHCNKMFPAARSDSEGRAARRLSQQGKSSRRRRMSDTCHGH